MPTVLVNDIHMYYEVSGEGEPLVLIGGLANDVSDYTEHTSIVSDLSRKYGVIAFDNRGVGRTDKPDAPYSIELMAADTAGLLQALGVGEANVVGVSMGGRIALALALERPEIVKRLVLVSTAARMTRSLWRGIVVGILPRVTGQLFRGKYPQPYFAFARQREASAAFDCTGRLHELSVPTLIMHGVKDRLTPYRLAEEMHGLLPGSKMVTFRGGHLFLFMQQREFVRALMGFLAS